MILPVVYHPEYVTPLPRGHRFPMPKFGLVYEKLVREGIVSTATVHVPEPVDRDTLALVHTEEYVESILHGTIDPAALRRIGLPWSTALARRTCRAVGGTLLTARLALEKGLACNTAGGTHHAHPSFGSGFCLFNDLAVTAAVLLAEEAVRRVLMVDLDVHQGDGTAAAFRDDHRVFTFSMHCESNFPFRKSRSDLDIALPDGVSDDDYMVCLEEALPRLVSGNGTGEPPDLVLYDAGVDVHRRDRLGRLNLSREGIARRDRFVLTTCAAAGVPLAAVIGGGYDRDVEALADRHCILHRTAAAVAGELELRWTRREDSRQGQSLILPGE